MPREQTRGGGGRRAPGPRRDNDREVQRDRERSARGGRDGGGGGRDRGGRGGADNDNRGGGRGQVRRGGGGGGSFHYQERSVDQVRRQAERQTGRFDSPVKKDFDIWRCKGGENTIRILPPTWENPEHYAYRVWMHRFIGSDGSSYLCPRKMLGKPCAICDAERDARDAGEQEEAKDLAVAPQWACWMLDRDGDDPERPQVFIMSDFMDKDIVSITYNSKRGDALRVDHPEEGYDLSIRRTGQGLKTKYSGYQFDREPTPALDDPGALADVLEFITANPIPDVLNFYDNSYLENVLQGTTDRGSKDDDEPAADDGDDGGDGDGDSRERGNSRRPLRARGNGRDRAAGRREPDPEDGGDGDEEPPFDPEDDAGPGPEDEEFDDGDGDGAGDDGGGEEPEDDRRSNRRPVTARGRTARPGREDNNRRGGRDNERGGRGGGRSGGNERRYRD